MADAIFEDPRLVAIYDTLDGARDDLDLYLALIDELGANLILDIGCGTGTLACLLGAQGKSVIGSCGRINQICQEQARRQLGEMDCWRCHNSPRAAC